MNLRILYCGVGEGTCQHRGNALVRLGHSVDFLNYQIPRNRLLYALILRLDLDVYRINALLLDATKRNEYDIVWIDKGIYLRLDVLRRLRKRMPHCKFVHYSPDDMFNPRNSHRHYVACIPWYDLHVTTKSYNVRELRDSGAQGVLFVDNAYEPTVHRPVALTEQEKRIYQADVGFLGAYESERGEMIYRLAEQGIRVKVWGGGGWLKMASRHPNLQIEADAIYEDGYAKAMCGMKICLAFLRKENRDLQTTRTMEIPACGVFMLGERTDEHLRLFQEGVEAAFFSSFEEMLEKCRYYLAHDDERQRIAQAGYQRCLRDGYDNDHRMQQALEYLIAQAQDPY